MPLRVVIPLPGPFYWVSGGGKSRPRGANAPLGPGFWACLILALAALGYGVVHVWWIAAIVGVLVLWFAVAVFRANTVKGHRLDPVRALWSRVRR